MTLIATAVGLPSDLLYKCPQERPSRLGQSKTESDWVKLYSLDCLVLTSTTVVVNDFKSLALAGTGTCTHAPRGTFSANNM
jgi:hypothetical protein